MKRHLCLLLMVASSMLCVTGLQAQGMVNDMLAGKLLDPEVGQWAWYTVTDVSSNTKFAVRQAIVGRERVNRKTGYWLELEIVPEVGYKTVYKMLLTGPASDPENVHRVLLKQGLDPAKELPVDTAEEEDRGIRSRRESLGLEEVVTLSGIVRAEHFAVNENGRTVDVWINEEVLPTGVVRFRSEQGEMLLRTYGFGGEDGQSVLGGQGEQSGTEENPEDSSGDSQSGTATRDTERQPSAPGSNGGP